MYLQVEYKYLKSSFPYITSLSIPKLKHPPQALRGGKEKKEEEEDVVWKMSLLMCACWRMRRSGDQSSAPVLSV